MLLVVGIVLLLVLPSPWSAIAFVTALVLFVGEVAIWNRTVRHRRVETGPDTLIGSEAVVLSPLHPSGQVQIDGEIWDARCEGGAEPGQTVTVVGRDRLTLIVAAQ
ncbi:MAG TPA: NfeD family protein [Gaiellaceae bacterium]|nr:NfeD family protein [Gaiellaceae bacterium]